MRRIAAAAISILLLGSGSILAVYFLSGSGDGGASPASDAAPAVPVPPTPDLSRYQGGSASPPKPMEYAPAPPRPPAGTWEAIPPVARPAALGPLGAALHAGLQELQPRISDCFQRGARAGQGVTAVKEEYVALPDTGATVLMLEVEALPGQVRIADAPVETRGGASDGLIACAQQVLRGQAFPARVASPGARHRVLYPLTQ
jgi:hypothetical protein